MAVLVAVLAPGAGCSAAVRALAVQQAAALSGDAAAAAEFAARGGVAGLMALVRCVSASANVFTCAMQSSGIGNRTVLLRSSVPPGHGAGRAALASGHVLICTLGLGGELGCLDSICGHGAGQL